MMTMMTTMITTIIEVTTTNCEAIVMKKEEVTTIVMMMRYHKVDFQMVVRMKGVMATNTKRMEMNQSRTKLQENLHTKMI